MNELMSLLIGLLPLYLIVAHNAIMVHLLARDHDDIAPVFPDGGTENVSD